MKRKGKLMNRKGKLMKSKAKLMKCRGKLMKRKRKPAVGGGFEQLWVLKRGITGSIEAHAGLAHDTKYGHYLV